LKPFVGVFPDFLVKRGKPFLCSGFERENADKVQLESFKGISEFRQNCGDSLEARGFGFGKQPVKETLKDELKDLSYSKYE
jgi:hypothetical protein